MLNNPGPSDPEHLRGIVAANVKTLRVERGLSLNELASRANVGKSTLSMLESGRANPSVETLWAIAAALDVPLSELIEERVPAVRVVRHEEGIRLDAEDGKIRIHMISSSPARSRFELYWVDVDPNTSREADAHSAGAVEHLLVVKGNMRCGPEDAMVSLEAGDMATFAADVRHGYESGDEPTKAVLVMEYR